MKKKFLLTMLLLMFMVTPAMAQSYRRIGLSFVDEFGQAVTNITSISIYDAGTTTATTIYNDRAGTLTVTNPITTSSTYSTFDQSTGTVYWFQRNPDFKVTVTDGTKTLSWDNGNELDTRIPWYSNYIGTAASLSVTDNQSITVGTDSDMVFAWNNGSSFASWIPGADGSAFNLGTSGTSKNVDFNWFVGTALGIKADEGAATLTIDGVATTINHNSNFATGINTGTSTGAVTIGSSTSGTLAFDTTSGITMNADDSIDITASGAAADIDVDSAAGSVIIDGGEAAADAVTIAATTAAGGIDITSNADIDITTTGAAGEDITITNTGGSIAISATENNAGAILIEADGGTSEVITIHSDQGTSVTEDAASITLLSDAGGIVIQSDADLDDAVVLRVDGGTSSEMTLHNDQGNTTDSIELLSDAGGITLNAAKPVVITNAFEPDIVVVPDGAAYDLLANNSGQVHLIPGQTADMTMDLPAEADGINYTLVYVGGAEDAQDWIIDSENNTNFFIGGLATIDDDDGDVVIIYSDGSDDSICTVLTPNAGTIIYLWCDGTNWYISGQVYSGTDTAVTFTNL